MDALLHPLLHLLLLLALPPLLLGVANRVKSAFGGRSGPPLLQLYRDLARLLRKGMVLSRTTTPLFPAGPLVSLCAVLLAGLVVPIGAHAPLSFSGDAVAFAYLLALGRFFTTAAALDTGSAFEGMGAAREASFACLAEPTVFFLLLALVGASGRFDLSGMLGGAAFFGPGHAGPGVALLASSLFVVLLAENCRIPFDDPNTHLELTMVHEVMVLDHSGPLFALVLYGAAVKFLVFGALLVRLLVPPGAGGTFPSYAVCAAGLVALAALVGVVESVMARLKLTQVPTLLVAACALAGFGFLLVVR